MEKKKATREALERRLNNAILHIDKTKDTKTIYFDDKGLRITVTDDVAIIATGAHQHVFNNITASGISRPYLYAQRFVEIALANDCLVRDAKGNAMYSYKKLFDTLKAKEDNTDYNLCWFIDLWLFNIFAPLYTIDETISATFVLYEQYLHNIACNQVILEEKKEDLTNLQYVAKVIENVKQYTKGLNEQVIFAKKTDEERVQEEIDALQEAETAKIVEEQANEQQQGK